MAFRSFAFAVSVCVLAACSPPGSVRPVEDRSQAVAVLDAPASILKPGRWRTTTTALNLNTPELPRWLVKVILEKPVVTEECVQAGDQSRFLRKFVLVDGDLEVPVRCDLDRLHVGRNEILVDQTCRQSADRSHSLQSEVTYAPDRLERSSEETVRGLRGPIAQTRYQAVAEWLGPCASP